MSAVDDFLQQYGLLTAAVDDVARGANAAHMDQLTLRGIAVQSLALFEKFVLERSGEWAALITSARIPASKLPDGATSIGLWQSRLVEGLPRRFKRVTSTTERGKLFHDLGTSLQSFGGNSMVAHDLFFDWAGSNISASDVESALSLLGVKSAWTELTRFWKRLDPGLQQHVSAKSLFEDVRDTRHEAAHNPDYNPNYVLVSSTVRNLRLLTVLFDCVGSTSVGLMLGRKSPNGSLSQSIEVRALRKDSSYWREIPNLSSPGRAFRRHRKLDLGIQECRSRLEDRVGALIVFDGNDIVEWCTAT